MGRLREVRSTIYDSGMRVAEWMGGIPLRVAIAGALVLVAGTFAASQLLGGRELRPVARESPEATATPTPVIRQVQPTPSPRRMPSPRPTSTPSPSVPLGADDRLTFLILGSDADATRISLGRSARTDAIILASIRADGTGLVLASLPRDTVDIPLPDGRLWTSKVNAIAPTLGIDIAREALEALFGVEIDRYAQINMDDLIALVDEVGGVSVKADHVLADAACTIPAGPNDLDGATALCFARHRYTDNDYARAGRQQQLLLAIRDAILESGIAPATLITALKSLRTDVDASLLPQLVDLLATSSETTPHRLVFGPPEYTSFAGLAGERGWISQPDIPAIRAAVARLFADD